MAPGSNWQQLSSDGEEEFDFVLDPQPDPGLVDGVTERQWDIQWRDAIGADAEELDPYERDSDDSMDVEPELPVMGLHVTLCNLVVYIYDTGAYVIKYS